MESTARLTPRDRAAIVIAIAAAATVAAFFIRWGDAGSYSLGPTLPWAYFISATVVGWILGSPRVLPHGGGAWRSRMLATAYLAIGLAAAVSLVFSVVLFYPDGVQRNIHAMFMGERALFTILGPLIYLVPLAISLPAALWLSLRDRRRALTVGFFALIVFTVTLALTNLTAEYIRFFLKLS